MRILIKNGVVVTDGTKFRADVFVEDGKIAKIAENIRDEADNVIDAENCYVMPGFIDTHTHFDLDLGVTVTADNFKTGTKAAVVGGTTTVLDFATQDRGMSMQDALDLWHKKAQESSCNYGFHMAVSEWNDDRIAEIDRMIEQGVTSFKMYMVYDNMLVDDGAMYDALKRTAGKDCIIGVHCENYQILQKRIKEVKELGILDPNGHPFSRPNIVEAEAVNRLMRIAEIANAPAWVVHLSTKEGLEEAKRARERGQEVYLETCPQYVTLDDTCFAKPDGAKYVMSPPPRKVEDEEAILEGMHNNDIDFIGTDHCSFTMEQKAIGKDDFTKIPNGGAGVQNRAQVIYSRAVLTKKITIEQMSDLMSTKAAKVFGMYPERGTIREGSAADIVVFDPNKEDVISYRTNLHNCDNSPYEGMETIGLTKDVVLNGEVVVENGKLIQEGKGKYIFRGKSLRPNKDE